VENEMGIDKILYDYGRNSNDTSKTIKNIIYNESNFPALQKLIHERFRYIGGHVRALKYIPIIGSENTIAFFRDPVKRIVSNYLHDAKHNAYTGSFSEFYRLKRNRNIQAKLMREVPLESIGFIGLTEKFEESINLINQVYGIRLTHLSKNRGDYSNYNELSLSSEQKQEIIELNQEDVELYQSAYKIFNERSKVISGIEKNYQLYKINVVDRHTIRGWCFKRGSIEPQTIRILFDDNREEIKAIAFRKQLCHLQNVSMGYIGFERKFESLLKSMKIEVTQSPETNTLIIQINRE